MVLLLKSFALFKQFGYKNTLLIPLAFIIISCSNRANVTLVDNVPQDTANNIILALGQNNIIATKQAEKGGNYIVSVKQNNQIQALTILKNNNLPEKPHTSIGEVFKKDGFISSPTEEQARMIYAYEQEIADMLSQLDGVINVKVQVSLPAVTDNLWQNEQIKPAVAVLIKYKTGYRIDLYVNRIKQLVSNSVPGLTPDRVEVLSVAKIANS